MSMVKDLAGEKFASKEGYENRLSQLFANRDAVFTSFESFSSFLMNLRTKYQQAIEQNPIIWQFMEYFLIKLRRHIEKYQQILVKKDNI